MNALPAAVALPTADPLAGRLRAVRGWRRQPGWAANLLDLARQVTLAEAGAVLARGDGGWTVLAPATEAPPPAVWSAIAEDAAAGRGVAAATSGAGGRWLFAAGLGPADAAGGPAALVLEVASALPMDLALTRERLAFLGALAEAGAADAAAASQAPQALAAEAARALLEAPERMRGLHLAAVTLAAALPGVERVTLVLPPDAIALSDQREVVPHAELPRRLLVVAAEAADRATTRIVTDGVAPTPAERALAQEFGARPFLSVPAPAGDAVILAFFPAGTMLAEDAAERLLQAAGLLGRVGRVPAKRLPRRRGRLIALGVAAAVGALALLPRAAEVAAPVVLQPERSLSITAPFDGILEASAAQPGDAVTAGVTPLARLLTREVELELAAARARAANDRRDATVARAAGQPAQEQIALLAARRAEAQVALLEYRLGLAEIRAPADGIIVAGDLRRSLGQPVARGQVLFEVALPGPLRAEVLVLDEHIPAVAAGQRVRLSPAAEPGRVREARVLRVRPMAEVVQGRNVFRVIAELDQTAQAELRPGMEGWARIETGRTTWLFWLVRDPVRWMRRMLWV